MIIPKIGKWLTSTIKDKTVIYSYSFFKQWNKKIHHWINTHEKLRKTSCISCDKGSKRYHELFTKTRRGVFIIANASIYSNASFYSGVIKVVKNFPSP